MPRSWMDKISAEIDRLPQDLANSDEEENSRPGVHLLKTNYTKNTWFYKISYTHIQKTIVPPIYSSEKAKILPEKKTKIIQPSPTSIAGRAFAEILRNPIFYVPCGGLVVANTMLAVPLWANIPLLFLSLGGEIAFWRKNWSSIYERHECDMEKTYRHHLNNLAKSKISPELPRDVAKILQHCLLLKENIETKVFSDGRINAKKREILALIEETTIRIVAAAADYKAPSLDINDALATLTELSENFDAVVRPLNPATEKLAIQTKSVLAQSTQALKNRMEESKQVRRLIEEVKKDRA